MSQLPDRPPVFGITGFKNSGKTTLTVAVVAELKARGFSVGTIKHAHHSFKIDDDDTDSAKHRRAGANQVAIVSAKRWALVSELEDAPEPSLGDILTLLRAQDIVIVEGYKAEPIPKIECRRRETLRERRLADSDPTIVGLATDFEISDSTLPVFSLDAPSKIADFIVATLGLGRQQEAKS